MFDRRTAAQLAGLPSARSLDTLDTRGLVRPAHRTPAGYRLWSWCELHAIRVAVLLRRDHRVPLRASLPVLAPLRRSDVDAVVGQRLAARPQPDGGHPRWRALAPGEEPSADDRVVTIGHPVIQRALHEMLASERDRRTTRPRRTRRESPARA